MCMQMSAPPHGVPISPEVHAKYSRKVKQAWETFDAWWKDSQAKEGPVSRSAMPKNVQQAMQLILETPIPDHPETTGTDSCYMVGVQSQMVD